MAACTTYQKAAGAVVRRCRSFQAVQRPQRHQSGDECLRAVANVIGEKAFRPTDLAARYGGEEFAIVLPETDHNGAFEVAERIRTGVMEMRIAHGAAGAGPHVTIGVGVALVAGEDVSGPDWL
jgi:diguanylate cyclase (GGDEF)-like protein